MRGAIAVWGLQRIPDVAPRAQRQPLCRDGGAADVAAQPFQLAALPHLGGHACVQGKAIRLGDPLPVLLRATRCEGPQRKGLLTLPGAEGDPVGD